MTRRRKNERNSTATPAAIASAQAMAAQRKTCEGCIGLRSYPRPMCQMETSPHFRQVRDTYHERCAVFAHMFTTPPPPVPTPPPAAAAAPPRRKRSYTTGDVARRLM